MTNFVAEGCSGALDIIGCGDGGNDCGVSCTVLEDLVDVVNFDAAHTGEGDMQVWADFCEYLGTYYPSGDVFGLGREHGAYVYIAGSRLLCREGFIKVMAG